MSSLKDFKAFADKNDIPVKARREDDKDILTVEKQSIDEYMISVKLIFSGQNLTSFFIKETSIFKNTDFSINEVNNIITKRSITALEMIKPGLFEHKYLKTTAINERTPENIFFRIGHMVSEFLSAAQIIQEEMNKPKPADPQSLDRLENFSLKAEPSSVEQLISVDSKSGSENDIRSIDTNEVLIINQENFFDYFQAAPPANLYDNTAIIEKIGKNLYMIEFLYFFNPDTNSLESGKYIRLKKNIKIKHHELFEELLTEQLNFFNQIQEELQDLGEIPHDLNILVMGGEYLQADLDAFDGVI